jgi:hypothetical protein
MDGQLLQYLAALFACFTDVFYLYWRHTAEGKIKFGDAKSPKPSNQFPKGTLKIAKFIGQDVYEYAWMDSCGVYFIDSSHGPGNIQDIFRKNSQGQPIPYRVPAMIGDYNSFMGGVDVFDQVQKKNGNGVQHATKKYTVRMFEVLWSMCLSQAYNVYRHVNRNQRHKQKNPIDVKIEVIRGLLTHEIVVGNLEPDPADVNHRLVQTEPGSRGTKDNRRKRGDCRSCLNSRGTG